VPVTLHGRSISALKPDPARQSTTATATCPLRHSPSRPEGVGGRLSPSRTLASTDLGVVPHLSLADARAKADALHAAGHGGDPAGDSSGNVERAFSELAKKYIDRHASKKRSGHHDVRLLNGSPHKKRTGKTPHVPLVTRWGSRKLGDIKRGDVPELSRRSLSVRRSWRIACSHSFGRCSTLLSNGSGLKLIPVR
jgi:hypothetical protein